MVTLHYVILVVAKCKIPVQRFTGGRQTKCVHAKNSNPYAAWTKFYTCIVRGWRFKFCKIDANCCSSVDRFTRIHYFCLLNFLAPRYILLLTNALETVPKQQCIDLNIEPFTSC